MKRHYEKIIVACCFAALFINIGLNSTSFAVYQPYIVAVPGVGDTGGSLVLSTRMIVSVLATLIVNRLYSRLEIRLSLTLATVLTGAAFVIYSFAGSLPVFLLGAVVGGIAYGFGGLVATTTLIGRWFSSGIGEAVGVATVGSGVAGFVIPVAATNIIEGQSLGAAFLAEAVLSFAAAAALFLLLRNRPSDLGLEPHESKAAASGRGKAQADRLAHGTELTRGEHRLVLVAMTMVGAFSLAGLSYLSVLFVSSGFDVHFAALLITIEGVCLTVSKMLVGELFDRLGTAPASRIAFLIVVVGFALSCLSGFHILTVALASAVCIGAGSSLGSVGLSVWSIELSSAGQRARSIRNCQVAYSFGGFLMNMVPGPLKELTGSYVTSYAIMGVLAIAAAVIILGIYRRAQSGSPAGRAT